MKGRKYYKIGINYKWCHIKKYFLISFYVNKCILLKIKILSENDDTHAYFQVLLFENTYCMNIIISINVKIKLTLSYTNIINQ